MDPTSKKIFIALILCAACLLALFAVRHHYRPRGVEVIYAQEDLPAWYRGGPRLFLAGPTWRPLTKADGTIIERRTGWRIEAVEALRRTGWRGFVFVPEFSDGSFKSWKDHWNAAHPGRNASEQIVAWEHRALETATVRMFFLPFALPVADNPTDTQLGFTTRLELGYWLAREPGSIVAGFAPGADGSAFVRYHARRSMAKLYREITIGELVMETIR